jgi:hypothetical protein
MIAVAGSHLRDLWESLALTDGTVLAGSFVSVMYDAPTSGFLIFVLGLLLWSDRGGRR